MKGSNSLKNISILAIMEMCYLCLTCRFRKAWNVAKYWHRDERRKFADC